MTQMDFGIIGNGQVSALIDRTGKMIWCCLPDPDSPSVFAHLLDSKKGGFWEIAPESMSPSSECRVTQRYLKNTAVLSTCFFKGEDPAFELLDFAPLPSQKDQGLPPIHFIRVLRPLQSTLKIRSRCLPRFEYGAQSPRLVSHPSCISWQSPRQRLFLTSSFPLDALLHERPLELNSTQFMILSTEPWEKVPSLAEVLEEWSTTLESWEKWVRSCRIPQLFQHEVIRSAITLKLLCFESTGAILAALTTSLPEGPEPGRTWDYRSCWWRDAYFVVRAFYSLGRLQEVQQFAKFILKVVHSEPSGLLRPVYGLRGEKFWTEKILKSLSGFKGLGPVRRGNAAYAMDQFDAYGEVFFVLSLIYTDQRFEGVDRQSIFEVMHFLVNQCREKFTQPDAGIWEFRGQKRHFLFSKFVMCSAVQRAAEIAQCQGLRTLSCEWAAAAHRMSQEIHSRGWREKEQWFAQSYSDSIPDASNLLMPEFGFVRDQDPRFIKMVYSYEHALVSDSTTFRYRVADDFGVPKTAFLACSFWRVNALWRVGQKRKAYEVFQQILRHSNHLGLLSEDIDPRSGELWGNFPQSYSHAGLIHSALLIQAKKR